MIQKMKQFMISTFIHTIILLWQISVSDITDDDFNVLQAFVKKTSTFFGFWRSDYSNLYISWFDRLTGAQLVENALERSLCGYYLCFNTMYFENIHKISNYLEFHTRPSSLRKLVHLNTGIFIKIFAYSVSLIQKTVQKKSVISIQIFFIFYFYTENYLQRLKNSVKKQCLSAEGVQVEKKK